MDLNIRVTGVCDIYDIRSKKAIEEGSNSKRGGYDFEMTEEPVKSSYPLGLLPAPLWKMLPPMVTRSMQKGLQDFSNKLKGYDRGILLGLESKTSSPIQVIRNENGLTDGFSNLFIIGEGSGYAGGIMSSAADGIRAAIKIVEKEGK